MLSKSQSVIVASALLFGLSTEAKSIPDELKFEIVVKHNTYRCMHGLKEENFVTWSDCVAKPAQKYIETDPKETDSSGSYERTGCAGPAAENYLTGQNGIVSAVFSWYREVEHWKMNDGGTTRHFTPIVWKDVKEIGCGMKDSNYVCNYKGDADIPCSVPNTADCYELQVPDADKSVTEEECRLKAVIFSGASSPATAAIFGTLSVLLAASYLL